MDKLSAFRGLICIFMNTQKPRAQLVPNFIIISVYVFILEYW